MGGRTILVALACGRSAIRGSWRQVLALALLAGLLGGVALGAVAGVVNVLADSVALVVPFLAGRITRRIVMFAVYGLLVLINIRGVRQGAGAVTVITFAKLLPLLLFIGIGIFFKDACQLIKIAGGSIG